MTDIKPHLFKRTLDVIPLSFMFLDLYADFIAGSPEASAGEAIRVIYAEVYRQDLSDEDLYQVAERLSDYAKRVTEKIVPGTDPQKRKPPSTSKQFGDYFRAALASLDTSEKLLWLAGYDVAKARHLYALEDFEVVDELITLRQKMADEEARLSYEASLFGFGGKYGSGSRSRHDEGEVTVTDLRGKSAAEMQAFMASKAQRR